MKDSSWLTPLHHAAAQGHVEAVRELLLRQADVMARDRLWMTPFHLAAHNNHVKCAGNGLSTSSHTLVGIVVHSKYLLEKTFSTKILNTFT